MSSVRNEGVKGKETWSASEKPLTALLDKYKIYL